MGAYVLKVQRGKCQKRRQTVKVINCGDSKWDWSTVTESDRTVIPECVTDVYYWYDGDSYEGKGEMLLQDTNGNWHYHNMGHCSCYGPLDQLELLTPVAGEPLDTLLARMSEELRSNCEVLVKRIKEDESK
jgi:hypothetical protein